MPENHSVVIFNIDESLTAQPKLLAKATRTLDLPILQHFRFLSERSVFTAAERQILWQPGQISFTGTGDYHHLTYLFLRQIRKPFHLVVFDHHSDCHSVDSGFISCGSWVREAAMLPCVQSIDIIGVSGEEKKLLQPPKVRLFTMEDAVDNPSLFQHLHGKTLYISIDKDVLGPNWAETTWDAGDMTLNQLLCFVNRLLNNNRLLGADVCGEWLWASNRAVPNWDDRQKINKNETANLRILEMLKIVIFSSL